MKKRPRAPNKLSSGIRHSAAAGSGGSAPVTRGLLAPRRDFSSRERGLRLRRIEDASGAETFKLVAGGCEVSGGVHARLESFPAVLIMDPIRNFCGKLRSLASTLDCETARLQRALDGEESVHEQEAINSDPELSNCENFQEPDVNNDVSDPPVASSCISEKSPRSPQLSDFGLERYMVSQVLPNLPQSVNNYKEEPVILTPPTKQSLVKVLKTPKCALKMDDFECVTPKLEHFGISEYTICLNEDYTMGLKNVRNNKRRRMLIRPSDKVRSNSIQIQKRFHGMMVR
ncbi:Spindle and kinetochore-associated protein 3 [Saguinus oedipus]|uniref:Spindle and kinetochore-associated protein 3 n=1 Tax=Saguinus oedipus TaxID=9490 RepID=A0ABQ9VVE1_SAGOE|nr:Spindle and kinetochore-associated protein 3 [Saguinus oedipus]